MTKVKILVCPQCNRQYGRFTVQAQVTQVRLVDRGGEFVRVIDECCDIIALPNCEEEPHMFSCDTCGTTAQLKEIEAGDE